MQYGFIIPNGDTQTIPELAAEAETAGCRLVTLVSTTTYRQ